MEIQVQGTELKYRWGNKDSMKQKDGIFRVAKSLLYASWNSRGIKESKAYVIR